jgi:TorA maturation chaperone TorD/formate hydrogenlyase subunit 6/NADH:ubiquinone oxidoreductase subunit I
MNANIAQARSRTYAALAQDFARPQEGLEAEYARLFMGPGRPVAHPYESVYREGRVMGDCALAVRQSYAVEGLAPEGHSLPDHVAIELEFMAHLARREAEARERGDEEEVQACLRRQEAFLSEHLGRWLPRFCQRVLANEAHPFYASLAQRTWEHVAQDIAQVRAWLSAVELANERGCWTVAIGSECTLCGLCARLCPQKALRLTQDEGEICLLFDPAPCNGCAACQQWCPEGAVTVAPSPPAEGQCVLMRSPLVTCSGCGQPYLPAALLTQVLERAAGDDEGLRQRLALCPACKTSPISSRKRPGGLTSTLSGPKQGEGHIKGRGKRKEDG